MASVSPRPPCFLPLAPARLAPVGAGRRPVLASAFTTGAPPSFLTGVTCSPLRRSLVAPPTPTAPADGDAGCVPSQPRPPSGTPPSMFSGGFLGVGPAEVFVIAAVGWLVLGPQRLYQVARDAGKVLGQLRRTADDAKSSFTDALEVDSLGLGSLSDPLGLGSSVATTKARKVQEREEAEARERAAEAAAAGGKDNGAVAGAADAVAAAVSAEPAGPAPAPVTAGAPAAAATATATTTKAARPAAPATVGSAVPEELVRKPEQPAEVDELAHFREQLRRVSDPNQTADLDSPAMAKALAADPLPPLAGDVPPHLDVPTDTALAELEAAYVAAKKKLLRKGLAELEAQADGEAGKKKA